MQQLMEFVSNHLLLSGGFVAVVVLLIWTEFTRRGAGFKMLSPAESVGFMNQDGAVVVDVSPATDFSKGHVLEARNIPVSRLKEPDKEVNKLSGKPVLVTCRTGQTAQSAAAALVKLGAAPVAVMKGGMAQWRSDSYPVTTS